MAKLTVEFENGVPKYILNFRNVNFDFSMNQQLKYGVGSDKPCFSKQLSEKSRRYGRE